MEIVVRNDLYVTSQKVLSLKCYHTREALLAKGSFDANCKTF